MYFCYTRAYDASTVTNDHQHHRFRVLVTLGAELCQPAAHQQVQLRTSARMNHRRSYVISDKHEIIGRMRTS